MQTDFEKYSDDELICMFRSGDSSVGDYLMEKYKALVKKKARLYYLEGGDHEDLLQEGMLGLFKAIREYSSEKEASFMTFASLCINRHMLSAIEAAGRKKNMALNGAISLDLMRESRSGAALGISPDPETIFMEQEAADELLEEIKKSLSPMENRVLEMYLDGLDYREIAKRMEKSEKSIDNALQRIRGKVKKKK